MRNIRWFLRRRAAVFLGCNAFTVHRPHPKPACPLHDRTHTDG
jgi:hypothetical protein